MYKIFFKFFSLDNEIIQCDVNKSFGSLIHVAIPAVRSGITVKLVTEISSDARPGTTRGIYSTRQTS